MNKKRFTRYLTFSLLVTATTSLPGIGACADEVEARYYFANIMGEECADLQVTLVGEAEEYALELQTDESGVPYYCANVTPGVYDLKTDVDFGMEQIPVESSESGYFIINKDWTTMPKSASGDYLTSRVTTSYDAEGNAQNTSVPVRTFKAGDNWVNYFDNYFNYQNGLDICSVFFDEEGNLTRVTANNYLEPGKLECSHNLSEEKMSWHEFYEYNEDNVRTGKEYNTEMFAWDNMTGFTETTAIPTTFKYSYNEDGTVKNYASNIARAEFYYTDELVKEDRFAVGAGMMTSIIYKKETMQPLYSYSYMTGNGKLMNSLTYEYSETPGQGSISDLYSGIWEFDDQMSALEWFEQFESPDEAISNTMFFYVNGPKNKVQYFAEGEILEASINPENEAQIFIGESSNPSLILEYDENEDVFRVAAESPHSDDVEAGEMVFSRLY